MVKTSTPYSQQPNERFERNDFGKITVKKYMDVELFVFMNAWIARRFRKIAKSDY